MFAAGVVPPKLAGSVEGGNSTGSAASVMEFVRWRKIEIFVILGISGQWVRIQRVRLALIRHISSAKGVRREKC